MYIILELEEIQHLVERVAYKADPDAVAHAAAVYTEQATDLIDWVMANHNNPDEESYQVDFSDDPDLVALAQDIVDHLFKRLMLRDTLQWVKVIDRYGSLVIRIKPGALKWPT